RQVRFAVAEDGPAGLLDLLPQLAAALFEVPVGRIEDRDPGPLDFAADQLRQRIAALLQPVGIDQPLRHIAGGRPDRLNKRLLVHRRIVAAPPVGRTSKSVRNQLESAGNDGDGSMTDGLGSPSYRN